MDVIHTNIYREGSMSTIIRGSSPNARLHLPRRLPREYLGWSKARVRETALSLLLTLSICRPIIDLVKTPARKKTAPKRTKAATSAAAKARNPIILSNIDEVEPQGDVFHVAGEPVDNHDRAEDEVENTMLSMSCTLISFNSRSLFALKT